MVVQYKDVFYLGSFFHAAYQKILNIKRASPSQNGWKLPGRDGSELVNPCKENRNFRQTPGTFLYGNRYGVARLNSIKTGMVSLESKSGKGFLYWAGIIQELTKAKITIAVTVSVATGHFFFLEHFSTSVFLPMAGVFLLACGAAALNQVQEALLDSRMERTKRRPIPSGRITREWALFVGMAFAGAGLCLLSYIDTHTFTVLVLAGAALIWYNVIYFMLKKITAFAVVPGALIGAIPPVIGWTAAGGMVNDPVIISVAFFFFLWQIPHFWLLLLIFGKDYEEAGLPSLTRILSKSQISRITSMWILAVAVTGLLMAVMMRIALPWNIGFLVASLWLAMNAFGFLKAGDHARLFPTFMRINVYALLIMIFLMGNALF
jgi:protoheme IX farnesyltransferase